MTSSERTIVGLVSGRGIYCRPQYKLMHPDQGLRGRVCMMLRSRSGDVILVEVGDQFRTFERERDRRCQLAGYHVIRIDNRHADRFASEFVDALVERFDLVSDSEYRTELAADLEEVRQMLKAG